MRRWFRLWSCPCRNTHVNLLVRRERARITGVVQKDRQPEPADPTETITPAFLIAAFAYHVTHNHLNGTVGIAHTYPKHGHISMTAADSNAGDHEYAQNQQRAVQQGCETQHAERTISTGYPRWGSCLVVLPSSLNTAYWETHAHRHRYWDMQVQVGDDSSIRMAFRGLHSA